MIIATVFLFANYVKVNDGKEIIPCSPFQSSQWQCDSFPLLNINSLNKLLWTCISTMKDYNVTNIIINDKVLGKSTLLSYLLDLQIERNFVSFEVLEHVSKKIQESRIYISSPTFIINNKNINSDLLDYANCVSVVSSYDRYSIQLMK